ncbi:MAG TPA: type II CAAX endopeptidase family protein [Chthoniobacterales bacterium]|nr:type II CAAX endopeptidase family protein [Chthoniobacterales bacterium]
MRWPHHIHKVKAFLNRHKLSAFFTLAYLLSWYPWIIALARGRNTGPNPLGPLVAGIVITAVAYGRPGLREYFSRIVRWRVGLKWYGIVFLVPLAICVAAVGITFCFLPHSPVANLSAEKIRELPDRFLFILLFIGLGEEPGWRGFALPELLRKHSALRASLILALLWAVWHLPLVGHEFPGPIVPAFLISVFGGTFMLTWLFNHTKGSVLLAMLFHATINAVGAGLIFPLFSGPTLILLWYVYAVLWLGVGLTALVRSRTKTNLAEISLPSASVFPS